MESSNMHQVLDNYGYHEPLPDEAIPLVAHMASDMADLRMQLGKNKKHMESLESTLNYQTKMLDPLQADNQQLLAENNDLYMRLSEMQDAQALNCTIPEPVPLVHRGPRTFASDLHALESEVRNLRAYGAEVTKREDNLKTEVMQLKHKNRMLENKISSQNKVKKGMNSASLRADEDNKRADLLNSKLMRLEEDIKLKDSNINKMTIMLAEKERTIALLKSHNNRQSNLNQDGIINEPGDEGVSDISYNSTNYLLNQRPSNQFTPRPLSGRGQATIQPIATDEENNPVDDDAIPEPYKPVAYAPSSNGVLSGLESDNLSVPSTSSDGSINRPGVSTASLGNPRARMSVSPEHDMATSKIHQVSGNLYSADNVHTSRYSRSSSPNTVHPCSMGLRHDASPQSQVQLQNQIDSPGISQMRPYPPPVPHHPLPYNMQLPNPRCINCTKLQTENAKLKQQISSLTSENLQIKLSNDTVLTNRDKFAMQMQSEVQERERVLSSLQTEVDVGRNQIATLRKENAKLQEKIELQQAEIAELTSANAVITTFSSKLEQKVADNIDNSLRLKEILSEYEANIRLSADKIKETARSKRALEKQLTGEREKISELKARIILDQNTIKQLDDTNKRLSKMMAQVVIENRHLRQVMTVDEVEDYVDVEKGMSSTVQPSALGTTLLNNSTKKPLTISMANDLLKSALKVDAEELTRDVPEQCDIDSLVQQYVNAGIS